MIPTDLSRTDKEDSVDNLKAIINNQMMNNTKIIISNITKVMKVL